MKKYGSVFNLKLVRSFGFGFTFYSLKLNGLYLELYLGCFHFVIRSKGKQWFGFNNYWNG